MSYTSEASLSKVYRVMQRSMVAWLGCPFKKSLLGEGDPPTDSGQSRKAFSFFGNLTVCTVIPGNTEQMTLAGSLPDSGCPPRPDGHPPSLLTFRPRLNWAFPDPCIDVTTLLSSISPDLDRLIRPNRTVTLLLFNFYSLLTYEATHS